MAASILYFGPDEWKRIPVIEKAGYVVRECHRIEDLESAIKLPPPPQAVLINSSGRGSSLRPALQLVRTAVLAPVIVFPSPDDSSLDTPVDLVIPPLTPPAEWLRELAELIEKTRALREDALSLRETSSTLVQQSIALRSKSAADRAASATLRESAAQQREKARTLNNSADRHNSDH